MMSLCCFQKYLSCFRLGCVFPLCSAVKCFVQTQIASCLQWCHWHLSGYMYLHFFSLPQKIFRHDFTAQLYYLGRVYKWLWYYKYVFDLQTIWSIETLGVNSFGERLCAVCYVIVHSSMNTHTETPSGSKKCYLKAQELLVRECWLLMLLIVCPCDKPLTDWRPLSGIYILRGSLLSWHQHSLWLQMGRLKNGLFVFLYWFFFVFLFFGTDFFGGEVLIYIYIYFFFF